MWDCEDQGLAGASESFVAHIAIAGGGETGLLGHKSTAGLARISPR
jgi:hypothetical protein